MIQLSRFMTESLDSTPINECVIAARKLKISGDNTYVLLKHRDRAYKPSLSIIHTVNNGMEMVYIRDNSTLWSEGMNSAGICILNSALSVEEDEVQDKLVKKSDKGPKFSKDGERIIKALTMNNVEDAMHFAKTWGGTIQGHTLITDGDTVYTMETTKRHSPVVTKLDGMDTIVRTNNGILHPDAGYQEGIGLKSSNVRKTKSEEFLEKVETPEEMLQAMRQQPFAKNSQLNPLRSTNKLFTSSQLLLNPKDLHFHLVVLKNQVTEFNGVVNQLPVDFDPQIKITFEEI
jgi:hypothetical protein